MMASSDSFPGAHANPHSAWHRVSNKDIVGYMDERMNGVEGKAFQVGRTARTKRRKENMYVCWCVQNTEKTGPVEVEDT